MSEPERLVLAFIEDFRGWNDSAYALFKKDNSYESTVAAKKMYARILAKYCWPDFVGEPIAFGSQSTHDPRTEVIVNSRETATDAIVRTVNSKSDGFKAEYEYVFAKENDRLYLCAVDFIDPDRGRYPCL